MITRYATRTLLGRPLLSNRCLNLKPCNVRNFASVGDKLPNVELFKGFPPEKVNLAEYYKDKSVIIVGLPGAFTPT